MLKWLVVVLSTAAAGYMLFDGTRALVVGDYVMPKTGAHAGELGPWARVVSAVGVGPRSTTMKLIFVAYGAAWLVVTAGFAVGARWAWVAMLVAAVGALWYLVVGTIVSVAVVALLFLPSVRDLFR